MERISVHAQCRLQLDQLDERATAQQQQFPRRCENPVTNCTTIVGLYARYFKQVSTKSICFFSILLFWCSVNYGSSGYTILKRLSVFFNRLTSCVYTEVSGLKRCDLSTTPLVYRRAFSANAFSPLCASPRPWKLQLTPPRGQLDGVFRQLMNY